MRANSGFSLIEVLIALALLGLIAMAVVAVPRNYDDSLFSQNLAGQLAESQIEICRSIANGDLASLKDYNHQQIYDVNTRGDVLRYRCDVTTKCIKVDPNLTNTNYNIDFGNIPTNGTISTDDTNENPDIIQVNVRVVIINQDTLEESEVARRTSLILK